MRESGILISGVLAAVAGVVGVVWLAMTGLAWPEGQLKQTTSYDESEVGLGVGIMAFFWIVGALLLLVAVLSSVRQARLVSEKKAYFHRLAWLMPLVVIGLVVVLWPIILDPGGASFAP